jgi:hypothetical protein
MRPTIGVNHTRRGQKPIKIKVPIRRKKLRIKKALKNQINLNVE